MTTITETTATILNALAGASLGASFYVLVKTHPYLVNRSYDPKHNGAYIARFMTGVIGGVILAMTLGPNLQSLLGSSKESVGVALTPGVLAILGGYSAEAVESVLQRLVEVLLSLVRGDGKDRIESDLKKAQADKDAQMQSMLASLEADPSAGASARAIAKKIRERMGSPA